MKTKLMKWVPGACACSLFAGSVMWFAGCVAPASVQYSATAPYYDYYYYPQANVYFYPSGHVYYWHDGSRWQSGRHVPSRYSFHDERRQQLRLHTREPWTEHHPEYH